MKIRKAFLISGGAGQGKSTITRNLAYALRQFGFDVLIVESDLKTPKLNNYVGIPLPKRTIQDVLLGKRTIRGALYKDPAGIKLLLAGVREISTPHPAHILERLLDLADVVLIDTQSHDTNWYKTNLPTLIVTHADLPSVLVAHKIGKKINTKNIILNRTHTDATELTPNNITQLTDQNILASIPADEQIREANHIGYSVIQTNPRAPSSEAIKQLAANLMNLEYKPTTKKPFLAKLGISE